jgi:hypothetical protein
VDEAIFQPLTKKKHALIKNGFVFAGEFPAAMQHGGQAHHRSSRLYCLIFCVCLLLLSP